MLPNRRSLHPSLYGGCDHSLRGSLRSQILTVQDPHIKDRGRRLEMPQIKIVVSSEGTDAIRNKAYPNKIIYLNNLFINILL